MGTNVTIKSYRKEREGEILNKLERGVSHAGMIVARQAKKNVTRPLPSGILNHWWRDTGQLAASIANEGGNGVFRIEKTADEIAVLVGTKLAYGLYLEFGTSRMPPYPWLFPACEEKRGEIKEAIKTGGGGLGGIEVVGGIWGK